MYPSLTVKRVEKPTTLREFVGGMGEDYLYALERGVLGVMVNNKPAFLEEELKPGDHVVVFPVVGGG